LLPLLNIHHNEKEIDYAKELHFTYFYGCPF
jgi:hypothetical protein